MDERRVEDEARSRILESLKPLRSAKPLGYVVQRLQLMAFGNKKSF